VQYYGNCGAHVVNVGGSNIGVIVVQMILMREGTLLGELWFTFYYCGREQYWGTFGAPGVSVGVSDVAGNVVHVVLLWQGEILGEL
jgi:hypothetical protein